MSWDIFQAKRQKRKQKKYWNSLKIMTEIILWHVGLLFSLSHYHRMNFEKQGIDSALSEKDQRGDSYKFW